MQITLNLGDGIAGEKKIFYYFPAIKTLGFYFILEQQQPLRHLSKFAAMQPETRMEWNKINVENGSEKKNANLLGLYGVLFSLALLHIPRKYPAQLQMRWFKKTQ